MRIETLYDPGTARPGEDELIAHLRRDFSLVVSPADIQTEKGKRTFSWNFEKSPDHQVVIFYREKNEVFGQHFHKGEDVSKNPELFLLLSGTLEAEFVSLDGSTARKTYEVTHAPIEISIDPWIFHTVKALTDCIFAEYRETRFDPARPDTFPKSEFIR